TVETTTDTITQKNQLIDDLKDKKVMFKENGKNILDEVDYFIIEQFGFYNFFDQNNNYMIHEKIDEFYKEYTKNQLLLDKQNQELLSNNDTKRLQ
ncbi:MAG: hypothetical protein WA945_05190, partial [Arcobacteraceae bacterium]